MQPKRMEDRLGAQLEAADERGAVCHDKERNE
jgi:hypothetical protein